MRVSLDESGVPEVEATPGMPKNSTLVNLDFQTLGLLDSWTPF